MFRYLKQNKLLLVLTLILGALTSVASVFISIILQKIIDIAMHGDLEAFTQVLLFTAIYMVALCLLSYGSALLGKVLLRNITKLLRRDVFNGILLRTPGDFYSVNTADYLSSLTNDIKMIEENYILPLLAVVELSIMFLAPLVVLFYLSPLVTACLLVGMALMFLIPALLGKALAKRQEKVSQQMSTFTAKTKDFLSGYEIIRGFGILPHTRKVFAAENKQAADVKFRADKMLAINEGLSETLSTFIMVVVIFVSAYLVLRQSITVGTLVALVQLGGTFITPIMLLLQMLPKIKGIAPVAARLNEFSAYQDQEFTGELEPTFNHSIAVENLTYSYNQEKPVLLGVNQTFQKGKKYAILGKSGCGKSTLIKMLTGYSGRYGGSITIDGQELTDLKSQSVTRLMAVIHQNIYMFDNTIAHNIGLEQEFDPAAWEQALATSGVNLFLAQQEQGLETPVGENGANLSGGQRQRVAVARALIRQTPIMILDEGTSSIDRQTAAEIENNLLSQEYLTLLTITHNLDPALLGQYDEIIYMEEGKIAAKGSLNQLLATDGKFREFYEGAPNAATTQEA